MIPTDLFFYKGKYYVSHQWFPLGAAWLKSIGITTRVMT